MNFTAFRKISATRQRELHRLNQIEKRRQLLELKRQNDLYDQMSFTVNNLNLTGVNSVQSSLDTANSTLISEKTIDQLAISQKLASDLQVTRSSEEREIYPDPGQTSTNVGKGIGEQQTIDETFQPSISALNQSCGSVVSVKVDQSKNGDEIKHHDKLVTSADQIFQFVTTCVPENKRVLCLIVRDKMSKLNRAKSYFYPTYYLFIQAIVDTDDFNGLEPILDIHSDDEIHAPASADNSFSASSSISADMMFIGTETAANHESANLVQVSVNSYSDNEVNADSETEDESARRSLMRTPGLSEKINHLKAKRNYENALVFPNAEKGATDQQRSIKLRAKPLSPSGSAASSAGHENKIITQQQMIHSNTTQPNPVGIQTKCSVNAQDDDKNVGKYDDLDGDGSDNEDGFSSKEMSAKANDKYESFCPQSNQNVEFEGELAKDSVVDWFDNKHNPFAGTYGVLLAGRRRKKAKT